MKNAYRVENTFFSFLETNIFTRRSLNPGHFYPTLAELPIPNAFSSAWRQLRGFPWSVRQGKWPEARNQASFRNIRNRFKIFSFIKSKNEKRNIMLKTQLFSLGHQYVDTAVQYHPTSGLMQILDFDWLCFQWSNSNSHRVAKFAGFPFVFPPN